MGYSGLQLGSNQVVHPVETLMFLEPLQDFSFWLVHQSCTWSLARSPPRDAVESRGRYIYNQEKS